MWKSRYENRTNLPSLERILDNTKPGTKFIKTALTGLFGSCKWKNNISSSKRILSHCGCCHTAYNFSFEFSILFNLYEKFHICKHSFDTFEIPHNKEIFPHFFLFLKKVKSEIGWICIKLHIFNALSENLNFITMATVFDLSKLT